MLKIKIPKEGIKIPHGLLDLCIYSPISTKDEKISTFYTMYTTTLYIYFYKLSYAVHKLSFFN